MGQLRDDLTQKLDANDVMLCIEFLEHKIRKLVKHDAKFATGPCFYLTSNAIYCRLCEFAINNGIHISPIFGIWLSNRINGYLHLCRQICEGHKH